VRSGTRLPSVRNLTLTRRALCAQGAVALSGVFLGGCSRTERREAPGGELSGASWLPVSLESSSAIRLPAPPARGSDKERAELEELVALAKARTPQDLEVARFWSAGASLRWNEIARELVAKHRVDHTPASRVYALLSVAQYDALVTAWNNKYVYRRVAPGSAGSSLQPLFPASGDPSYPSEHAAVAAASAAVLSYLFPDEAAGLEKRALEHQESRLRAGMVFRSDTTAGDSLGRAVASAVIARARTDGSDAVWSGRGFVGPGRWSGSPGEPPATPRWSEVRSWLLKSPAQFRAVPPPTFESPEFRAAVADLRRISDTRTEEQIRVAALWADALGSSAPSGRWNKMAADLIQERRLSELRAARVFALLNVALMDAGIACWDSKYHHWLIRPWQVDPGITTPVGRPNHPSYPSGHAVFSGAASEVLGYLFPEKAVWLRERAEEAALSRELAGIHYRFDSSSGLAMGRAVAQLAIQRGRADGAP
jgi:membrane-associated phospholipid phosphatase